VVAALYNIFYNYHAVRETTFIPGHGWFSRTMSTTSLPAAQDTTMGCRDSQVMDLLLESHTINKRLEAERDATREELEKLEERNRELEAEVTELRGMLWKADMARLKLVSSAGTSHQCSSQC
jgi:hypothetical protein